MIKFQDYIFELIFFALILFWYKIKYSSSLINTYS